MRPRVRAKTFFGPGAKIFAEKFGGFRNLSYLCRRDKDSGSPLGRAHVRRSATMPGIFFAQLATDKTAAIPKE